MDLETGKWVRVGKIPGDRTDMMVCGLEPGHKYKFRVSAVNDEGDSEPLVAEQAITAKNPYGKHIYSKDITERKE
jgi:hypothetical protein